MIIFFWNFKFLKILLFYRLANAQYQLKEKKRKMLMTGGGPSCPLSSSEMALENAIGQNNPIVNKIPGAVESNKGFFSEVSIFQ